MSWLGLAGYSQFLVCPNFLQEWSQSSGVLFQLICGLPRIQTKRDMQALTYFFFELDNFVSQDNHSVLTRGARVVCPSSHARRCISPSFLHFRRNLRLLRREK